MIILFVIFILFLLYYASFLGRILKGLTKLTVPSKNTVNYPSVTVIIPFRNEAKNILASMQSILSLNYPEDKYEVLYVDDNSSDSSASILAARISKRSIRILKVPEEFSSTGNKKRAIQYGIQSSTGDIIITTDADCIHHTEWLIELIGCFDKDTALVSGPVDLVNTSDFFSGLQQTEFRGLVLAGAGLIGSGKPVICNGANLAYRRTIFNEIGGFSDNMDILSGDDVFLMLKLSRSTNYGIRFCSSKKAVVHTKPASNLIEFFRQRKRWASKNMYYQDKILIFQLILIFFFYLGLFFQLLMVLNGYQLILITLSLSLIVKIILEYIIINKGETLFFSKSSTFIFIITELLQIPYIIVTALIGSFGRITWKALK